ncbi:MAG: hypothetical protein AAFX87_21015 [Bacteroidota bacterium]
MRRILTTILIALMVANVAMANGGGKKPKKPKKNYTKKGFIKPGTRVIVRMKDGTQKEAIVAFAYSRKNYWLNEAGGGNFGECKKRFFTVVDGQAPERIAGAED